MKHFIKAFSIICVVLITACAGIPTNETLDPSLTPEEIIALAQNALDSEKYKAAKAYYEIIIERFSNDSSIVVAAEFEIGHILIKQKKYNQASVILNQVISRYNGSSGIMLPQKYKKLAENDLASIQSKLKKSDEEKD